MPTGVWKRSEKQKAHLRVIMSGRKLTVTAHNRGKKNVNWKGGVTPINERIRKSQSYVFWREKVFKRDDYRCFDCGERGGKLHAHHIYPFARYSRLRFMVENGMTLCVPCHRKIPVLR